MRFEYSNGRREKNNGISGDWIVIAAFLVIPWLRFIGVFMLLKKSKKLFHIQKNLNWLYIICALILAGTVGDFIAKFPFILISSLVILALIAFGYIRRSGEGKLDDYMAFIGERAYVNIDDLASAMGVNETKLRKDVHKLKASMMLPKDAYIDEGRRLLIIRRDEVPEDDARAERARRPQPAPKPETRGDEFRHSSNEEYDRILREIRALNVAIDDDTVSRKIERIEEITANIFHLVEQKPERSKDIQAFMEYYLPTTLKLLKQYARLEHQPAYGENITGSKARIESILDKLVAGFEKQLDMLFKSDAIDISSDIKVLEKMMEMDGLTDR